jgi:hypothetical protein
VEHPLWCIADIATFLDQCFALIGKQVGRLQGEGRYGFVNEKGVAKIEFVKENKLYLVKATRILLEPSLLPQSFCKLPAADRTIKVNPGERLAILLSGKERENYNKITSLQSIDEIMNTILPGSFLRWRINSD